VKGILICVILLLVGLGAVSVSPSTTWRAGSVWHPEGDANYYTLGIDRTDIDSINLTDDSFLEGSFNITQFEPGNMTLYSYNGTFMNYTNDADHNVSLCSPDFPVAIFSVNHSGSIVDEVRTLDSCLTYNISTSGYTEVFSSRFIPINCTTQSYSLFDGGYSYAQNQSFNFSCFPIQDGCYPYKQTSTQYIINWTNILGDDKAIFMYVNESVRGYTIKSVAGSDNYNGSKNITATNLGNSTYIGTVADGDDVDYWFYIDTFYPFEDYYAQLIVEACYA